VTRQSAHINKASILFVREIDNSQTKGEVGHRPYPFVSKLSIAVRLYMPLYTLTGEMHCAWGQHLSDLLNKGVRFLAFTNVQIAPARGTDESVSFVAINKAQIKRL